MEKPQSIESQEMYQEEITQLQELLNRCWSHRVARLYSRDTPDTTIKDIDLTITELLALYALSQTYGGNVQRSRSHRQTPVVNVDYHGRCVSIPLRKQLQGQAIKYATRILSILEDGDIPSEGILLTTKNLAVLSNAYKQNHAFQRFLMFYSSIYAIVPIDPDKQKPTLILKKTLT